MRQTGAYLEGRHASSPPTARPPRSRTPGPRPGSSSTTASGPTTRRSTAPQFQNTDFNPDGYPFFTGKVAMSPNYLWSTLRGQGRRRRLEHGGDARPTRARRPPRSTPTRSASSSRRKNPDEAFTVLPVPARRTRSCSSSTAACRPSSRSRTRFLQTASQADYTQPIDWKVAKEGVNYADVPNFESYTPAYNETLDLIIKFGTKWQATPGLEPRHGDRRPEDADAGHLGQGRQLTHGRPQRRPPPHPVPASPGWRGGGRAGATSSSRRGSSGSSLFTAFPMIATFVVHVHQHQPRPGRAAPVRRPGELRQTLLARPAGLGLARRHAQVRALALPVAVILPFVVALMLHSRHLRGSGVVPRPVLPAVRRAVRGRRPDLGRDAQPRHRLAQRRSSRRIGIEHPPGLAQRPGLDLLRAW